MIKIIAAALGAVAFIVIAAGAAIIRELGAFMDDLYSGGGSGK